MLSFYHGIFFVNTTQKKHRDFDTVGIKVAVLSFCLKALLISFIAPTT